MRSNRFVNCITLRLSMNELQEDEKKWIQTILRMEVTENEKLDYLLSEGFDIEDIFEVALEES